MLIVWAIRLSILLQHGYVAAACSVIGYLLSYSDCHILKVRYLCQVIKVHLKSFKRHIYLTLV